MDIKQNLLELKREIAALSGAVELVAVSKFQDSAKIQLAIDAGQRVFGENRVQEAGAKWPELKAQHPDIRLHLIGALQTNKAAEAVRLFDVIHSVDRPKLADCLYKEMVRQQRFIPCLVQVNIGFEAQKAGIMPDAADDFIAYCCKLGLNIQGLMCIPPENSSPEPYFRQMREIATMHKMPVLSMGMSADFATAIKCGATHVRVGTAIFGARSTLSS